MLLDCNHVRASVLTVNTSLLLTAGWSKFLPKLQQVQMRGGFTGGDSEALNASLV